MQTTHLYDAICRVNRGIDEAVQGLRSLKGARNSGLTPSCLDETAVFFELHRSSLNAYFCNRVERIEKREVVQLEKQHRKYERKALDEIQVYRDLAAVEERRRAEGKPPKARLLTPQEQQDWKRQFPKATDDAENHIRKIGAEQP